MSSFLFPFNIKSVRIMVKKSEKEKKIERKTKKFMKSVKDFLASKSGGSVPSEWGCSLMLLEEYYKMFIGLTEEINNLPSLVVDSRYGSVPHPLLGARDKAAIRLEAAMKSVGITFKESVKMDVMEVTEPETALEKFVKGRIEKR